MMVRHLFSRLFFILFILGLSSCDFTSGLNQDILSAQKYVDNQQFSKAVDVYERILKKGPSKLIKTKINYQLAEIYYLYLDQQLRALKYYQYIVENVDDPLWQVKSLEKMADINFSFAKNFDESIRAYQMLMQFKPRLKNYDYYFLRVGESYFEMGRYQKAREVFNQILDQPLNPYHVEAFNQMGLIEFYNKNWDKAVDYWLEYLKREKRKEQIIKVKFLIANAYESGEKLKEAYNIYYSLLPYYPNPEMLRARLKALYARRVARKR
ncbi:MAG TPA: tetratricopeptide repeat protein [Bacteriovoracaceae bacterium]|nr:tetratricopeptide repeat protein [Bacteriovoracaceae bacterium]